MPDVADTILAAYVGLDRGPEDGTEQFGNLPHGIGAPAADVEGLADGLVDFQRQAARLSHVEDAHEVAVLQAILEDEWRVAVQEARSKDRQHACVRIRQRLPRAEDVEESKRDGGNVIDAADH